MRKPKEVPKKWYEGWEVTVHSMGNGRQVIVYHFPNLVTGSKVVQFQAYSDIDPIKQVSSLLESALFELSAPQRGEAAPSKEVKHD